MAALAEEAHLDAADRFFLLRYGRPDPWDIMLDDKDIVARVVRKAMATKAKSSTPCGLVDDRS